MHPLYHQVYPYVVCPINAFSSTEYHFGFILLPEHLAILPHMLLRQHLSYMAASIDIIHQSLFIAI